MKLELQFEQFLIHDLWEQVRENFKRDGYLAHVGIFLTDQPKPEIASLDKLPKMMIENFLQMSAERLQASVVITISEGWITPREILDKSGQPSTTQTNCDTNGLSQQGCPDLSNFFGSQASKRVHVVIIKVQSALGKMKSFTPITRPELPESFEPFSYTSEPKDIAW